ncbi:MAG: hypothetical protein LBC20_06770 [Planctomycetaceae bacterium]|jgi:hypothetical protein|nr:hypothetical protein [Planctomycetaceae bacterium]
MKACLDQLLYGVLLTAVLLCPSFAFAEETAQEGTEETTQTRSAEFVDPAFDRYINIAFLGLAWETQDASALTDAALQLAEGERILLRSHKTFTSKTVLEKALAVATDQKDTVTLERIAKIAKANGDERFVDKVTQTIKLAAASRAITTSYNPVKEDKIDYYFINTSELIERVRVTGDKKVLADIADDIKKNKEQIGQESADALLKIITESQQAVGDVSGEEQQSAFALEKLAGESRFPLPPDRGFPPYSNVGWHPHHHHPPYHDFDDGRHHPPIARRAMTPEGPVLVTFGHSGRPPMVQKLVGPPPGMPIGPSFPWKPYWGPPPHPWF